MSDDSNGLEEVYSQNPNRRRKVGIITLHYVDNHGGVLLVYALQEKIRQLGYESLVIDYDPTPVPGYFTYGISVFFKRIWRIPLYLKNAPYYLKRLLKGNGLLPSRHPHKSTGQRARKFAEFRKSHLKVTSRSWSTYDELKLMPPEIDCGVCGSDQIWNPFMCRNENSPEFDPAYFLQFMPASQRVSYAPSISVPEIPAQLTEKFKALVNGIHYLSCREQQGVDLICKITGRTAELVLDPALLLNADEWRKVCSQIQPGKYLLCYFLGEGTHYREYAKALASMLGLPIRVISPYPEDVAGLNATSCHDIGPGDFVALVSAAQYVCTDSFHGTLFSIVFSKPFFVFERPGSAGAKSMSSRIHSVLLKLGLTSRLIGGGEAPCRDKLVVDFTRAHEALADLRNHSVSYLKHGLEKAIADK